MQDIKDKQQKILRRAQALRSKIDKNIMMSPRDVTRVSHELYLLLEDAKKKGITKQSIAEQVWPKLSGSEATGKLNRYAQRKDKNTQRKRNRHTSEYGAIVRVLSEKSGIDEDQILIRTFSDTTLDLDAEKSEILDDYSPFIDDLKELAKVLDQNYGLPDYYRQIVKYSLTRNLDNPRHELEYIGEEYDQQRDHSGMITHSDIPMAICGTTITKGSMEGLLPSVPLYRYLRDEPRAVSVLLSKRSISIDEWSTLNAETLKELTKREDWSNTDHIVPGEIRPYCEIRLTLIPSDDTGISAPAIEKRPTFCLRLLDGRELDPFGMLWPNELTKQSLCAYVEKLSGKQANKLDCIVAKLFDPESHAVIEDIWYDFKWLEPDNESIQNIFKPLTLSSCEELLVSLGQKNIEHLIPEPETRDLSRFPPNTAGYRLEMDLASDNGNVLPILEHDIKGLTKAFSDFNKKRGETTRSRIQQKIQKLREHHN